MTDSEVLIKHEPLEPEDYEENCVFPLSLVGVELKSEVTFEEEVAGTEFVAAAIKEEPSEEFLSSEDFEVVEEQSDYITVNAGTLKGVYEREFVKCMQEQKQEQKQEQDQTSRCKRSRKTYEAACPKCKQRFYSLRSYTQHVEYDICVMLERYLSCPACPLCFSNQDQLQRHLDHHSSNLFFCRKHCGRYFNTLEDCLIHEYREHLLRNIRCYVCNHKFTTSEALSKHMTAHSKLTRLVCSYCRDWFTSREELLQHWRVKVETCGKLMKNVVNKEMVVYKKSNALLSDKAAKHSDVANFTSGMEANTVSTATQNQQQPHFCIDANIKIKNEPLDANEFKDYTPLSTTTSEESPDIKVKSITVDANKKINLNCFNRVQIVKVITKDAINSITQPSTLPMQQLKVIKFVPSTKVLPLPITDAPAGVQQLVASNSQNKCALKSVKLKAVDMEKLLKNENLQTTEFRTTAEPSTTISGNKRAPVLTINRYNLEKLNSLNEENVKQLLADATKQADREMCKLWLTKDVMEVIENMPKKRALIEDYVQRMNELQAKEELDEKEEQNIEEKKPDIAMTVAPKITDISKVEVAQRDSPKNAQISLLSNVTNDTQNPSTPNAYSLPVTMESGKLSRTDSLGFSIQKEEDNNLLLSTPAKKDDEPSGDNEKSIRKKAKDCTKYRPRKFTCTLCDRVCSSKAMYIDHLRANCSRDPQYPCPECSKKFFSASTLNCHRTIHTGVLPFSCNFCDKRFRTRGQVTVHHRTHTGERPFACQVCSQSFTHRETLISHLSRHIGMKRYKCYGCDRQFSCISGLKMHRESHRDTCGKVKFNPRAVGPRVRVVRGTLFFEPQPEINPYLRTDDPQEVLAEIQNQQNQEQQ